VIDRANILRAKVLIVDDQAPNILLLDRMLRGAGYTSVVSTTNPTEVCARHRESSFDLILLDLEMPGMDGFQVMEGLKEIEKDSYLPVLVITAQPEHRVRALKAGAKDFVSKPLDLAEVSTRVYNMLEVRLLHLEMRKLYEQVVAEQTVSERLLLNVLPQSVAERLKTGPGIIADSFSDVTVLFADIVGFTTLSQDMSPARLVTLLDGVFTLFDDIVDHRGLEKIKTIGDAYMAVAGLPVAAPDHAVRAAHAALDMMEALKQFNHQNGHTLQVRIGVHSGAVMAGVIGKRKFIYDLWGDAVNTASRMESQGMAGRVQLTEATRRLLREPFLFEERGRVEIKGKGELQTWFLCGRRGAAAHQ
jgi:adenylate cyclase